MAAGPAGLAPAAGGDPTGTGDTGPGGGAAGTEGVVQTLAGPGYCPGGSTPVPSSQQIRALAVDDQGRVFFETGPAESVSVIATVTSRGRLQRTAPGQVATIQAGIPLPPVPSGAPLAVRQSPAVAGRMVADGQGGVFVAAGTRILHLTQDTRRTMAGNPEGALGGVGPEQAGDGGPARQARFRSATSLARDAAGNLYIADHGGPTLAHATIRFLNRTEEPVTFFAGAPHELTIQPGHIDTIAGSPDPDRHDSTDLADSPRQASLLGNVTVAVEGDRLYLAHPYTETSPEAVVDVVNLGGSPVTAHGRTVPPGAIQTVAGGGDTPQETIPTAAGIAIADQDLYIADPARHRIHHINREGFKATLAGAEGLGATVGGFNGNNQPAVGARLDHPIDVATGPDGEVYIADRDNGQVRVVDPGGHIRGLPSHGLALTRRCEASGGDVEPPRAEPSGPASVATDEHGTVYFALPDAHLVKRRTPDGRVATIAGTTGQGCVLGCAGFAGDGGPATQATLDTPTAVAVGPNGGLYIYDGGNARVRYVNLTDSPVTAHGVTVQPQAIDTIAGTGTPGRSGTGGPALQADLPVIGSPHLAKAGVQAAAGYAGRVLDQPNLGDLAVDPQGNLFIAEPARPGAAVAYHPPPRQNEATDDPDGGIRRITADGTMTAVAGTGAPGDAGRCCANPSAITVGPAGGLYAADLATYQVWHVNPSSESLTAGGRNLPGGGAVVVAGTGRPGMSDRADDATTARLLPPTGLAAAADHTVYLATVGVLFGRDLGHYLHSVSGDGALRLLAGNGQPGFNGDALDPRLTALNLPVDLTLDPCGNLVVADAGNQRVRRIHFNPPCNPAAIGQGATAGGGGLPTVTLGLLGVAVVAATATAGWYWRRRTR